MTDSTSLAFTYMEFKEKSGTCICHQVIMALLYIQFSGFTIKAKEMMR